MKALLATAVLAALTLVSSASAQSPATVRVVMHDPHCHWFAVGSSYKTNLSVKGPVRLANYDEATLLVAGPKGVQKDAVGKQLTLVRGTYRITMVGQAKDDNHLKLVVS